MNNSEIRRKILEMTYGKFQEHPYNLLTPKELKEALNIDLRQLHYNIVYLEEKGLVELRKPLEGGVFVGARITARGIDLVEDEYRFDTLYPRSQDTAGVQLNVFKEFDLLLGKIQAASDLSAEMKELLAEEIKEIQKELKKIEPSYGRVKSVVTLLKTRNEEIYREVRGLLNHPVIARILADSARQELD